jgi:hypothetical protein
MSVKRLLTSLFAITCVGLAEASLATESTDRWYFRVYLDDREIGYHEFVVMEREGGQTVEITADFDVKILFFNAYSYDHVNEETWTGACLEGIEASTSDNGTDYAVSGRSSGDGFLVSVNRNSTRIGSDCVRSFAYWNPVILESESLLNSQTGEVVDVTVREHGLVTLNIDSQPVAAEKFTLEIDDGPIHLWYSPGDRRWLALEAQTDSGRMLRYVPMNLPWTKAGDTRLVMD